ncbi:hypothetical protein SBV1_1620006 [Verrucomicrobia bacterium]|nr:hypothetical protein SBV1_1620006 [Verrucomicrobiota bacterium]
MCHPERCVEGSRVEVRVLAIVLDGTFEPVNKGKAYQTSLRDSSGFWMRSVDSKSTANFRAPLRGGSLASVMMGVRKGMHVVIGQ